MRSVAVPHFVDPIELLKLFIDNVHDLGHISQKTWTFDEKIS